jgi:medium-chain acyl-[acyl-carrier-protein] hydrolase
MICLRQGEAVRRRLFCFPYAGGGASVFRSWANDVPLDLELCAVQLPGREDRCGERPFTDLEALVPVLREQLRPSFDLPFAFFGHSMGALIAFELTRSLRGSDTRPQHLVVSGRRAPHLPARKMPLHTLPDDRFQAELRSLQGTPDAVFADPELMEIATRVLRADFTLCETYSYAGGEPLDETLSVFGGMDDQETTREELEGWREHTRRFSRLRLFPGNHFFLRDDTVGVVRAIVHEFNSVPAVRRHPAFETRRSPPVPSAD